MKKSLLIAALLITFLLGNVKLFCQDELKEEIKEAVQSLDVAYAKNDFDTYMEVHSFFERLLSMNADNYLAKYYLAYTEYRLYQFKQQNPKVDVEKYYELGVEKCKDLIAKKQFESEAMTILSGLHLMHIAGNQMKAMELVPLINELLAKAHGADTANPRAYILEGILISNTPPMFGGSPEKGLQLYAKAISLFESAKKDSPISWGLAETYAWIGQGYVVTKQLDKAKEAYEKALKLEPDFVWVKMALLPQLEKLTKQQAESGK